MAKRTLEPLRGQGPIKPEQYDDVKENTTQYGDVKTDDIEVTSTLTE
jgi:hypothetical protein